MIEGICGDFGSQFYLQNSSIYKLFQPRKQAKNAKKELLALPGKVTIFNAPNIV